ncbi:phage tail protein [Lactiplantibacillus plantarum]|nr:phage tail protein [Lactiplantibacillus plantarum]
MIPSANIDKLLVGKKLTAADISANTFSTNNGTFTVKQDGSVTAKNMTLIGGTLTSPTINASTINGSTINGTTFNAGDVINDSNNTAKYYPMTITSDGAYKSTYFDSAVGLQSSVESGAISYKYRSMIGSGAYLYDNVAINGQGITLDSGTTTTKDTTFSAAETENAYISLTTEAGLYLHGSNANIDFGGHLNDDSTSVGMYMNPYGNLIAKSASQYWQISVAGNDNTGGGVVARFGIDSASAYNIEFNRELDIGNFHISPGHTFTSADGGAIHFAKGRGGANDIYAGDVHYNSLVKSSLLSVKRDVQKADTAYWAQLVNSIDLATYQYKSDDNTSHIRLSSIVDDVNDTKQWQLPDVFISRDENGKLSGVDDSVLLNATLATVQEQQKQISALNGHLLKLEAKLNG